jgi:toxin ParE1/3/4
MELTVYWTQFAENKLEDVFAYYSEKVSISLANRLINDIIDKSIELEKNPFIGQRELLLADRIQEFRYLVYKSYKIIYWINRKKQRIEIVNLFDCRQNPQKINEI